MHNIKPYQVSHLGYHQHSPHEIHSGNKTFCPPNHLIDVTQGPLLNFRILAVCQICILNFHLLYEAVRAKTGVLLHIKMI